MTQIEDVEGLKDLSVAQLRELWKQRVPRQDPPRVKSLLLRELAWRSQRRARGGLDAETRTLLRAAMRKAEAASDGSDAASRKRSRSGAKPRLQTGAQLVRTWGGVRHEVTVLAGGKRFEYRGSTYRSLSAIARAITGTHWSGPRFFGLHRVRSNA